LITRLLKIGIPILLISWLFSGCGTKKYISDKEQFINKYKVSVANKPSEIPLSELKSFFRPKANRKILGVRWKLSTYYKLQTKKQTKFRRWLFRNFGEEPVFYEEDRADRIAYKMEKYLDNLGFFNSDVSYTLNEGKKQVDLIYHVKPAQPYLIRKISYDIADTVLKRFFLRSNKKSLIKVGDIYNAYTFDNERDRITNSLRNSGYYYFNRNYIQFVVDSSFLNHELELILKINNIKKQAAGLPGKSIETPHTRYLIKNVQVIPDWSPVKKQLFDTISHEVRFWNDTSVYQFQYLLDQKRRIKPKAFNSSIYIWPGKPYSALELQRTYRQLFNFRIIRTANITFDTTNAGKTEDGMFSYMNSRIQMQTAKLNSFQIEVEGTNSSGDLGVRGSVVYANKNIFKMGDVFSLRLKGGFEAQSISPDVSGQDDFRIFNTFEAGISGNFYFPRFLFIVRLKKFNQRYHPVTNINFGFNYQVRPNYDMNVLNLDIGYTWDQSKQVKHILTPINFNYVQVNPTIYFDSVLQNEPNQRLREQYSDHMIFGLKYSYIFNNQNLNYLEHFNYLRVNVETSGNLLYGINSLMTNPATDSLGNFTFFGVRYAQYFRINADFRHYYYFANKTSGLVFRILLGLARPYGNSTEVPFEKGFYGGGANDMRGWQFRTLGPGSFAGLNDTITNFERVGDIQIQGNVEYRFPIYRWLKGSIFADVGNIWLYKKNETFVNGEFEWDKFYREFAIDLGIGIRLDFSFFIFRLDVATPIVDPKYPEGERTRTYFPTWRELVWNFGIGYPF
jgi:outer membrane protein assembly factor BamA